MRATWVIKADFMPPHIRFDYQPPNGIEDANALSTVSKYIEAPSDSNFEIRTMFKPPFTPQAPVHAYIMLDGNYVLAPLMESASKDACEGYKYAKSTSIVDGTSSTQKFRFSNLMSGKSMEMVVLPWSATYECTEERDKAISAEAKRKISDIGQIMVFLYYIEGIENAKPAEIPRASSENNETFSQKALKASVTAGDSLTYQTR